MNDAEPQIEQKESPGSQHPLPLFAAAASCFFLSACFGGVLALLLGLRSEIAIGVVSLAAGSVLTMLVTWRYRALLPESKLRVNQILRKVWLVIVAIWLLGLFLSLICSLTS